jgi:hypothetical protein
VKKHPRKEIYNCISSDFIGEWDPVNSEVTTLDEGEDPDAGQRDYLIGTNQALKGRK